MTDGRDGRPFRVGIVGCGNIAGPYARDIAAKPELELVAATDLDTSRAEALVAKYGGTAVPRLDGLLELDLDIVVNLTFQHAHAAITRRALEAGRHVHSEKPLAMSSDEAWNLVRLADERGLRLACSPFTLLNEGQQTAWKTLRSGAIGDVRAVFAEVHWGWIESWHPAPVPFYEVGPLVDVGVYPLTIITAILGPARRVRAFGRIIAAERVTKAGLPFRVETPDFQVVILELENGASVRLTASFYLGQQSKGYAAVEFHGDRGSLWLDHFFHPNSAVEVARLGDREPYVAVPPVRPPGTEMDWGRAIVDLADAIATDRPHRATGEQAAHIVDILEAATDSMAADGAPVEVTSSFAQPAPMPWAQ